MKNNKHDQSNSYRRWFCVIDCNMIKEITWLCINLWNHKSYYSGKKRMPFSYNDFQGKSLSKDHCNPRDSKLIFVSYFDILCHIAFERNFIDMLKFFFFAKYLFIQN